MDLSIKKRSLNRTQEVNFLLQYALSSYKTIFRFRIWEICPIFRFYTFPDHQKLCSLNPLKPYFALCGIVPSQ